VFAVEQLDAFADRVLRVGTAPALAVAVTDRERTIVRRTYGAARPDALWPVASIGKSFTAVLVLQLVEEGVLDLDAPVSDYVPWLAIGRGSAPVTLHHLLTHTAGLIESSDVAPASNYDVIALAGAEPGLAPGEHRWYSNIGYRAVGVVLETVTGIPYGDLLQRRILDRLDLRETVPVMRHETRRRLAGGHAPFFDDRPCQPGHGLAPAPWVESAEADGCLCASTEDLAAWLRSLWTGSGPLSASSLAAMKTALPPRDEDPYGYGLEIGSGGFGHTGDMLGYVAYMWADTDADVGVVAFANGFRGARWLGEGALAIATGREPPAPAMPATEALADDGTCPQQWAPYVGRYRSHNPWLPTFLIAAAEGSLVMGTDWLGGSERFPLAPIDAATFRVGEVEWSPERVAFDTVIDGRAQRAVHSGTPYYRAFTG